MPRRAFPLPDAALTMHTLLLGKTRAGKSSVMRLIVERLLDEAKPVTILDPKGDWWGLKSSADGKRAGYGVVIFGGDHADVPINDHSGKAVAELVATGNRPAIIDLGGWMVAERTRFYIDFAAAFFKLTRGPRWLAIDECHNFAPQIMGGKAIDPQAAKMVHWSNRLASEGSGKGVTLISASQRPQKVHKDYVSSHETLIAMRVIHPLDRRAVKDWIDGCDDVERGKEVLASLAQMERGEGWAWSPEAKFGPVQIKFPLFSTYDSFAAPTGHKAVKLQGWADVDLAEVTARLAAVVEEAKANDPAALKAEVAKLKRELAQARKQQPPAPAIDTEAIKETAFSQGVQAGLRDGQARMFARALAAIQSLRTDEIDGVIKDAGDIVKALTPGPAPARPKSPAARALPKITPLAASDVLSKPQLKVLEAIAFFNALGFEQPTRAQIGAAAGYSPTGGGLGNLLGSLRSAGYVEYPAANCAKLTDAGAAAAPPVDHSIPVRERLASVLSAPQQKIIDALPKDGSPMSREDLGAATDYSPTGGGLGNLCGSLRTLGFVTYPQPNFVAVEPWIWT